jgi:hypothetical protein
VPQIISSVLSYTSQGGQKAPYNLAGRNYVVELVYAKPGEKVKMMVNGEGLYANPGSPTVTKDGTIIFVIGVELKSTDRSDVNFLMLSPTTSASAPCPEAPSCSPCKECPSCPTPTHIMSVGERQTWTVKMPNGRMNEFDVELLGVSETSIEAKFKINGEVSVVPRGEVLNLNDGSMFVVTAIKGSQVEAAILPVSTFWMPAGR